VTSSRIQSSIISFATLAVVEPEDIVNVRANKIAGGTWQGRQSFTSGHVTITDSHDGARVGRDRRSDPVFTSPGVCSSCKMQGMPKVTRSTMRKRTRHQTSGLVLRTMFFIQDRAEVFSAQILKMCPPPAGATTVVAHVRARTTLIVTPMSPNGFMWRPLQHGRGSYFHILWPSY
jgi:hypothetical protein